MLLFNRLRDFTKEDWRKFPAMTSPTWKKVVISAKNDCLFGKKTDGGLFLTPFSLLSPTCIPYVRSYFLTWARKMLEIVKSHGIEGAREKHQLHDTVSNWEHNHRRRFTDIFSECRFFWLQFSFTLHYIFFVLKFRLRFISTFFKTIRHVSCFKFSSISAPELTVHRR